MGSIPGSGRSPGGHGNPFQYFCLENPMDREAWLATVHSVEESNTEVTQHADTCRLPKCRIATNLQFFKKCYLQQNEACDEAKVTQLCQTLFHPMECSLPGSSVGFSRQEYWSGLLFSSPGDLPNLGMEHRSPTLQVDSLPAGPQGKSYLKIITSYFLRW